MDTLCGRNRRILSGLAEREQNKGVLKPTPDFKGTTHARIVFSLRQSEQYAAILSTKCVHTPLSFSSFGEPPECFFLANIARNRCAPVCGHHAGYFGLVLAPFQARIRLELEDFRPGPQQLSGPFSSTITAGLHDHNGTSRPNRADGSEKQNCRVVPRRMKREKWCGRSLSAG